VVGEKVGFCLINTSNSFTMENGQSSTTLPGYAANSPYNGQPSTGCGLTQGVHVGKADEYSSGLQGQWLDVTGVPNGQYFLEITLDGENAILESNDSNNAKTWAYTLNVNPPQGGITPDEYDDNGENNNSFANATDLGVLGVFTKTGLNIHWGQDDDYFKFVASSSGTYTVRTTPAQGNVDLYLYDANQTLVGSSTADGTAADTVTYTFVEGQTYYARAESYNSTTSNNYQMAWTLKPRVDTFTPARTIVEENPNGMYFAVRRNGPTLTSLTVPLTIGGNAVSGVDYQPLPTSVTFDVLTSEIQIPLIPIDNQTIDNRRTVTVTINSDAAYVIGVGTSSLTIVDQDGGARAGFGGTTGTAGQLTRAARFDSVFNSSSRLLADDESGQTLLDDIL
jgi:hypothetical protein